jgi:sugar/nucleoside kinase (ribokinase family)
MSSLPQSRVIVIGELNVDIVATGLTKPPRLGGEILAAGLELTLGSASAIFACGMARLGHRVTFVSRVGADDFGDFCLAALRAAGVATRKVSREAKVKTGITVALSTSQDRALVTYPGSIASLKYDHLDLSLLRRHRHLHMTSYYLQTGLRPSFARIFRQAKQMGLSTSFDPNSDPQEAWSDGIQKVWPHADILFLNEREALQLTGTRRLPSALRTLSRSVRCVVIKLGAKGAVAFKDGELVSSPGISINTLDTTGAGDSFDAGFVSAYLRGETLVECLRTGNACGALSTLKPGGTAGQPNLTELKGFLKRVRVLSQSSP